MAEKLRFATYNCEWFNSLFDDDGRLLADNLPSSRYDVTRVGQLAALGSVFTALDADAVMVIEAPDTNGKRSSVKALERFAAHFHLRTRRAITGFRSDTEQEISLLYDPDRISAVHDPKGEAMGKRRHVKVPRFDGSFRYDQDTDAGNEPLRFSKPPLELELTTAAGRSLRMIGVHAKSKAPHGARNDKDALAINLKNRRKQLAQCLWLRQRVTGHLEAGDSLIVLGDFNDGPGLDEFEQLFGRSGIEIVLGHDQLPALQLFDPHAEMALTQRVGIMPTSARFYLAPLQRYFEALLDFIMVSPDIAATAPRWRIWHPLNDPACWKAPELREALLTASDHFPVTIDLTL